MFNKVKNVFPLDDYKLLVQFCVGVTKIYDVKPLFEWKDIFKSLKENDLFYGVYVDVGGYGIVWNDELDISAEGIYEKGVDYCVTDKASLIKDELLADYIKIRRDLHVSQKQLENMTHIPQSCIARLETTSIDPKISTLVKLLAAMGYTLKIEPQE